MMSDRKKWLSSQYEFGFHCAVQGWHSPPGSQNNQECNKAQRAGFDLGKETVATYEKVARDAAEKWVEKYET